MIKINMNTLSRRRFLKSSLLTTASLTLPVLAGKARQTVGSARIVGANEDIRVAVVGFGSRGGAHIDAFSKMKGVRLTALCDCDSQILQAAAKRLEEKSSPVETYTDVRKLLENKDIDV